MNLDTAVSGSAVPSMPAVGPLSFWPFSVVLPGFVIDVGQTSHQINNIALRGGEAAGLVG